MKVLILSDIHANYTALQAVLQDAGQVDQIWCAGDLVDYGVCPHETVAWFRSHEVRCVSGNHDRHLLHILQTGETEAFRGMTTVSGLPRRISATWSSCPCT